MNSPHILRRLGWIALGAFLLAGSAAVLAQGVLAQLGLTEASARKHILDEMEGGGALSDPMVDAARKAYAKLPVAARGQATTAFYAWTKAYVNSPAFKMAYDKLRADRKPMATQYPLSVDQELKAKVDEQVKSIEDMIATLLSSIPPADRAQWQADLKAQITVIRGPEMMKAQRAGIEETRARYKADYDLGMEQWNKGLPADPMIRIARHLREFLDGTTDVDFSAKYTTKSGMVGPYDVFDNPAYNDKPWQWKHAYYVGADALAAGRTAAQAWLKELGAK